MSANNNNRTAKTFAGGLFGRYIFGPLADWRARQRAMNELMALDDHMLKDIGIARCQIPGIVAGLIPPRPPANENQPQQSKTARQK